MSPPNRPREHRGRFTQRYPPRRSSSQNEDAGASLTPDPLAEAFSTLHVSGRTRWTQPNGHHRRLASLGCGERQSRRRRRDDPFEGLTQRLSELDLQTHDAYDYSALSEAIQVTELEILSGLPARDRSLSPLRIESPPIIEDLPIIEDPPIVSPPRRQSPPRRAIPPRRAYPPRRVENPPSRETEAVSISRVDIRCPTDTPAPRDPQQTRRLLRSYRCREPFLRTPRQRLEDDLTEIEQCWDEMEAGHGPPIPMTLSERERTNFAFYEPFRRYFEVPGARESYMRWYREFRLAKIIRDEEREAAEEAAEEAATYGCDDPDLASNN